MGQTKATRQGDYIAPPTISGFNKVTTISVSTSAGSTDLHSGIASDVFPDGYYVTLKLISGGPAYFAFASSTGTTATTGNTWALASAGEQQSFLLDPPQTPAVAATGSAPATATPNYPHRYIVHIGDASATVKFYVSTKQEPV